ncbi:hypothetical protein C8R45DRAFT_1101057 [Mycena sanguinolenta]|nr:hypothetical protein C8R45DRAFT_1101057 [Mycena sanguinolenta]
MAKMTLPRSFNSPPPSRAWANLHSTRTRSSLSRWRANGLCRGAARANGCTANTIKIFLRTLRKLFLRLLAWDMLLLPCPASFHRYLQTRFIPRDRSFGRWRRSETDLRGP